MLSEISLFSLCIYYVHASNMYLFYVLSQPHTIAHGYYTIKMSHYKTPVIDDSKCLNNTSQTLNE